MSETIATLRGSPISCRPNRLQAECSTALARRFIAMEMRRPSPYNGLTECTSQAGKRIKAPAVGTIVPSR